MKKSNASHLHAEAAMYNIDYENRHAMKLDSNIRCAYKYSHTQTHHFMSALLPFILSKMPITVAKKRRYRNNYDASVERNDLVSYFQ